MSNIIEVKGLRKVFSVHHRENNGLLSAIKNLFKREMRAVVAVDDISFSVKKGDIRAFIGPNGSGKSTTIKILSGVLFPSEGMVNVMGYIPWHDRVKYVRNIGVHFGQKTQLTWELPAIDAFSMYKVIYRIPEKVYLENFTYLVSLLGIEDIIRKPVRNLSLGERMKCEFVCTLLHEPDIVFLDEPTIGIDILSKNSIREFIKKINKEKGTTFIVTTHDLNDIENLCRTVTIINNGKIVFDDTLQNLKTYFSNKKIIDIRLLNEIPKNKEIKFKLRMIDSLSGRIELDTSENGFQNEISRMLKELPVADININTIDIETIIKKIYTVQKCPEQ